MIAMKKISLLLLFSILFTGCQGPRYHYKQGMKFAEARVLKQSVTEFKYSIDRRPNNAKYLSAMSNYGTALLEELYTNYRFADGNDSLSVYKFLDAEKWTNYLKPYISVSRYEGFYTQDFQSQKRRFMANVYERCHDLIRHEHYAQANTRLKELARLDKNYKDVQALLRFSEVEPIYTEALHQFEMGEYRRSYYTLEPMHKKYPEQNELQLLMEEALERGKYRIGIVSDPNLSGKELSISSAVQSRLISEIYAMKDPFIELVDRTNFELIQQEQEAIVQGSTAGGALTQEILSANAYLKVTINIAEEIEGELLSETKKGYERYYIESKNKEGETVKTAKYKKVFYREFTKENSVHYIAELILTNRATSQIISVKTLEYDNKDNAHYIEYRNDQLFPGYWKYQSKVHVSDRPEISEYKRKQLNNLRKASRSLQNPATMRKGAINNFARTGSLHIKSLDLKP
ncbi:MAG: hypothetical protein CMP53_07840 [Flavobacteriales bacterium]|nr:hypothetical protein [Flavobacteriales bacterium]